MEGQLTRQRTPLAAVPRDAEQPQDAPADTPTGEASTDDLRRQLHAAVERAEQYAADLTTYKRHAEAELGRARESAQQEVLAELGEQVYNLEQALRANGADAGAIRDGVALVLKGLQGVFERHGLQRIEAAGQPFDPALHEAVLVESAAGHDRGVIIREVSPGFRAQDGRVVRPARVTVAG